MKILNFESYSKGGTKKKGAGEVICNECELYSEICLRFNSLLILISYGL